MSAVCCPHECVCDCDIHDSTSMIVHGYPCCEGRCPMCLCFLLRGTLRSHLENCHNVPKEEAAAMKHASPFDQRILQEKLCD